MGYLTRLLKWLANQWCVVLIFEKFIEAIAELIVSMFPIIINNLPTEASTRTNLTKLKKRAVRIHATLDEAEQNRQIESEAVLLWLSELRSIAFDTEDLNDEFEARSQIVVRGSNWRKLCSAWYYWGVLSRVGEINKKYDEIYEDREKQVMQACGRARVVTATSQSDVRPIETGSLEGANRPHGRHSESEGLICSLLQQTSSGRRFPPVLSITGGGGMGKTALAQFVFNYPSIAEHFKPLIWVSVSSPNPDPVKTIKKIIEAVTETNCNLSTLDMLQRYLRQLLSNKMFLLVLDGVYTEEDIFFWDIIWTPLITAKPGSKVLVTTRNQKTAQYMGSFNTVNLIGLNSNSLWLVLKDEAFPDASTSNSVPQNLESIGREIAAKCYGSPLAAKLLGRTLCRITDETEWDSLLQDMPDPDAVVDNILPSLKLSYKLLPLHLKRCFAYCSIFPKGHEFDRDDLVKLWVAEGLLKSEQDTESKKLEDFGKRNFNELLSRSFFHPYGVCKYVMPGAIHDLAQSVSVYECFRVDNAGVQHGKLDMTRYASLCADKREYVDNVHEKIYEKKYLRTLVVCTNNTVGNETVKEIQQQKLFNDLRFLRSLDLSRCKFDGLDESVGDLIHLRYLNLSGSLFVTLPDSVCKLLKLQTLILDECNKLKELPSGMSSLTKMRHIGMRLNWEKWDEMNFDSMPPYLGKLISLQTLSRFFVGEGYGFGITELQDLNLRGELCISNLENVASGNDAGAANLISKKYLESLMLRWSGSRKCDSTKDEEVIRQLYPSNSIKSIWIEGYNGSKFPSWIADPSYRNLATLKLLNCKFCANLPQVAKLPQLERLYLMRLDKIKDLNELLCQSGDSVEFQSLELLHIFDMPKLEKFIEPRQPTISLTRLSELSISNCPELKQITYLPSSLRRFELRNCTALMLLPSTVCSLSDLIVEKVDSKVIWWIQTLNSLTSLSVSKVPELKCITWANLSRLSALKTLKIDGCDELESIARGGGPQYLPSLQSLDISHCAKLQMFFDLGLPYQIEELHLKDLKSLNALPSGLDQLLNIHTIEIHDVPMLSSVPMMPLSLHILTVNGCQDLEEKCKRDGSYWPNVQHVRCLHIGEPSL